MLVRRLESVTYACMTIKQAKSHMFLNTGHEIDFENVEILDHADNSLKLSYKEM